jgi:hypothetical protein
MGEHDALLGRAAEGPVVQRVADNETENKIADFGRSLFGKGKSLIDGVQKQAQQIDIKGMAEKAGETVGHVDTKTLAQNAGKFAGAALESGQLNGIAGSAVNMAFPQLAIIDKGSNAIGDMIARKQAKSLLDSPQILADKLSTSFDEFDREKTGFLDDAKLRRSDGITGIGSDNRAVAQILRSGFTTFNSLDGDASKKGISRKDVEIFSMMQNKDLLSDYVNKTAFEHSLAWGTAGAFGGAAAAYLPKAGLQFSMDAARSVGFGKIAGAAALGAVVVGTAADLISKHSQNKFYEQKSSELEHMFKAMKNSF